MNLKTTLATTIIETLYLKNRNFCSNDYDDCLDHISDIIPLNVHVYSDAHNSWQVPPKWNLKHAFIKNMNDITIYKADHPLKVIGLSSSYTGNVSRDELLKHLHYDHRFSDAIPYHFRQFYRPWERTWGFCVPRTFYNTLKDKTYFVHIATEESNGTIKVAEHIKQGETPYTFTFVAHLDHPGMANDDLAGVAVGIELFKKLQNLQTKFTYKLLLVPEIIGSEFYLGLNKNKNLILESCFLEMLGSKTSLALQRSQGTKSFIEKKLLESLSELKIPFNEGPFKSIICNDEYIWESHQIPMCSLSRFPYKEYHTHFDNPSIISEHSLDESVNLLYQTILKLEKLTLIKKKFTGTPCFSHPTYNLYVDPGQRAFGTHANQEAQNKRLLMDLIPAQKELFFLESILERTSVCKKKSLTYLKMWEEKKLISIY